jgi:hypothetical protein
MMNLWFIKIVAMIITIVPFYNTYCNDDTLNNCNYFFYPKNYQTNSYKFLLGISLTKLPTNLVEEEISTIPMLNTEFRYGLPLNLSFILQFSSNYISNLGAAGIQWSFFNHDFSSAIGFSNSVWFGHLDMQSIKLKSFGVMIKPFITFGMDFKKFKISSSVSTQYNYMKTDSDDELLGEFYKPHSLYSLNMTIEQPLWKDNMVLLGINLNYATFYYQSWLVYSAINQYILYPEVSFGFIL